MTCGVYSITHRESGRVYVGESVDVERRAHLRSVQLGNKHCLGRRMSEASKQKLRAANLGRKLSAETRAKISATKRRNAEEARTQ
jgi:hypothetical protein